VLRRRWEQIIASLYLTFLMAGTRKLAATSYLSLFSMTSPAKHSSASLTLSGQSFMTPLLLLTYQDTQTHEALFGMRNNLEQGSNRQGRIFTLLGPCEQLDGAKAFTNKIPNDVTSSGHHLTCPKLGTV
jgi:hypothetical protein